MVIKERGKNSEMLLPCPSKLIKSFNFSVVSEVTKSEDGNIPACTKALAAGDPEEIAALTETWKESPI